MMLAVMMVAVVLAHQGGWDEILLVLAPIGLFAGLLALANKRAGAQLAAEREASRRADAATDADD